MPSIYQTAKDIFLQNNSNVSLAESFAKSIEYIRQYPESASYLNGASPESEDYINKMASRFIQGRSISPSIPATVMDEMIGVILSSYYDIPADDIPQAFNYHRLSMSAENVIGSLLEAYLASVLEPAGWVWCSGSFVKAVDFIKPDAGMTQWSLLQVKNRDNSENSSSSAIRNGTQIKKWFRTFSRNGATNWENFPDEQLRSKMSEEKFKDFIINYMEILKK